MLLIKREGFRLFSGLLGIVFSAGKPSFSPLKFNKNPERLFVGFLINKCFYTNIVFLGQKWDIKNVHKRLIKRIL